MADSGSFSFNKMSSMFGKIFTNWKILFSVLGVILFISLLVMFLKKRSVVYENFQDDKNSTPKTAEIMLFYADWCPHCKTAKPEWEQVKTEFQGKTVNGHQLMFKEVNCTEESPESAKLMKDFKVEGFPTIKLVKDGQTVDFSAKPTKSTLTQFINSAI